MRLIANWRGVLKGAYSMWLAYFIVVSSSLQAALVAIGVDWIPGPKGYQFLAVAVITGLVPFLRILEQKTLHDDDSHSGDVKQS